MAPEEAPSAADAPLSRPPCIPSRAGFKRIDFCLEGEKERHLLFDKTKLKFRDRTGSTIAKSANYAGVTITLDQHNPLSFTLGIVAGKKSSQFALTTKREGERDLVVLALKAFSKPSSLDTMPVAPSAGSSALHLAAVGSISALKADGGGASLAACLRVHEASPPPSAHRPAPVVGCPGGLLHTRPSHPRLPRSFAGLVHDLGAAVARGRRGAADAAGLVGGGGHRQVNDARQAHQRRAQALVHAQLHQIQELTAARGGTRDERGRP